MSRIVFPLLFLALAAQAQVQTHGVPASITSPGSDGRLHGVPSSITSPTPIGGRSAGFTGSRVIFGNPRQHHRRGDVVPVPVFYPVYIDTSSTAAQPEQPPAEPAVDQADLNDAASAGADALREAYARGAQDALAELRARRSSDEKPKPAAKQDKKARSQDSTDAEESKPAVVEDAGPPPAPPQPTVFIFRDGRRLETVNYAIVGQTLFDFSAKPLRKIKIAELDLDATRKVNDDLGTPITLHY